MSRLYFWIGYVLAVILGAVLGAMVSPWIALLGAGLAGFAWTLLVSLDRP